MPRTKRRKKKEMWINIAVMIAAIALCFAILEFALRFVFDAPLSCGLYSADSENTYANKANIDLKHKEAEYSVRYITNNDGIRDERDFGEKSPGTLRILTAGDSFAFGLGLNQNETFQHVMEKALQGSLGKKVEVINAGVGGYGTGQALNMINALIPKYNPDYVVFGFYNNDVPDGPVFGSLAFEDGCVISKNAGSFRKFVLHLRSYQLYQGYRNMLLLGSDSIRNFLYRARGLLSGAGVSQGARIGTPVIDVARIDSLKGAWRASLEGISSMDAACREDSCRFILVYIPDKIQVYSGFRERYLSENNIGSESIDIGLPSRMVAALSSSAGIESVDLMQEFSKINIEGRNISAYYDYDPHFNAKGAELWGSILAEKIEGMENGKE